MGWQVERLKRKANSMMAIMEYNSLRDTTRLPHAPSLPTRTHTNAHSRTRNQNLTLQIATLNQSALELAGEGEFGAAMEKLREGEKLLEYAAESCRDIRKQLILVVLHNMASASQAKWDLATTSNYLEALIYNLELTDSHSCNLKIQETAANQKQKLTADEEREKWQVAEYYLQFCAVNSQLQQHGHALLSVRKSLSLLQSSLLTLLSNPRKLYEAEDIDLPEWSHRSLVGRMLLQNKCMGGEVADRSGLINYSYILWKGDTQALRRHPLSQLLRGLSIGDVMTIGLKAVNEPVKDARLQNSLLYLPLIASMAFFSLATELRLVEDRTPISEARNAHALAILFYQLLIPFESPYLHHIRDNYVKIYGIMKPVEISPRRLPSCRQLMELLMRDSILQGSLQQDSIATLQQQKRKGERLKQQSQRLKHICMNQVKPKQPKSNSKKSQAKSLTMSHHKQSLEVRDSTNKGKFNTTDLPHQSHQQHQHQAHQQHPHPPQDYYKKTTTRKRKERKQTHIEDFEEKYYDLAFKRPPFKSPSKKRKDSIRSSSSTKDRSHAKPSPIKPARSEKEVEKLVRVRSKQRLKS